MCSDLFTKNLPHHLYEKHASVFVGCNEYMLPTDKHVTMTKLKKKKKNKNEVGNIQVQEGVGL
jgi:hypothetical protein